MVKSKDLFADIVTRITLPEDPGEIHSIAYMIMEKTLGLSRAQILANVETHPVPSLSGIIARVNNYEPIQYVFGEADFFGRSFFVDNRVLIPRPETEQLVEIVITMIRSSGMDPQHLNIVDIGTGSGCIPITLALELKNSHITGLDISKDALTVARANTARHQAPVHFAEYNVMQDELMNNLDWVVSNPPYVTHAEMSEMNQNVLQFEPRLALFVPDDSPLIFYEAIAEKAARSLGKGGGIGLEINATFSESVSQLLRQKNFNEIQIVKDISGKDRFVTARK